MISKFGRFGNSYTTLLTNFNNDTDPVLRKIDTGAAFTTVSAPVAFGKYLGQNELNEIETSLKEKLLVRREFISASGDSMIGYLTFRENVDFPGFRVARFYLELL